ncbi:MAG: protein-export chaperone SecB, partial [Zetaproteobacteria bacterium CG_4_8_14_3_um_filter_59_5]
GAAEQPKIDLNLGVNNRQVDEHLWEVSLKVSALARNTEDDKVIFEVEVEHAGLFLLKNIPDEHILRVLGVDCPTIIFPFTRQLVSQLTSDGGFMPLLLDPFNFAVAYQQRLEEQHTTH